MNRSNTRDADAASSSSRLVVDPQSHAAVRRVAHRLRAQRAVDEDVGHPALADAEAQTAAIFEPALVADGRRHHALAGDGGDDAGLRAEGLDIAAIDIALEIVGNQVRPLPADLDERGLVGAGVEGGIERIERDRLVGIALHPLPELPDLHRGGDFVARRYSADPAGAAIDRVILRGRVAVDRHRAEAGLIAAPVAHLFVWRQDRADV